MRCAGGERLPRDARGCVHVHAGDTSFFSCLSRGCRDVLVARLSRPALISDHVSHSASRAQGCDLGRRKLLSCDLLSVFLPRHRHGWQSAECHNSVVSRPSPSSRGGGVERLLLRSLWGGASMGASADRVHLLKAATAATLIAAMPTSTITSATDNTTLAAAQTAAALAVADVVFIRSSHLYLRLFYFHHHRPRRSPRRRPGRAPSVVPSAPVSPLPSLPPPPKLPPTPLSPSPPFSQSPSPPLACVREHPDLARDLAGGCADRRKDSQAAQTPAWRRFLVGHGCSRATGHH